MKGEKAMEVSQVTGSFDPSYVRSTGTEMGKEDFLKLLITQLRHQDPLSPIGNTELAAQLAQFSALEQMFNLNERFDQQSELIRALNNSVAVSLVGKRVAIASDTFEYDGENPVTMSMRLSAPAAKVVVEIVDDAGAVIDTITLDDVEAGITEIEFDGTDPSGNPVPEGRYRIKLSATDSDGEEVTASTIVTGVVESLLYEQGAAFLKVNGTKVPLAALLEVLDAGSAAGQAGEPAGQADDLE